MHNQPSLLAGLMRVLVLLVLALLAIVILGFAFFPFGRLAPTLSAWIEDETRVSTQIAQLETGLSASGPYVDVRGIALRWPTGETLALDSLRVSPAFTSAWLRGTPAAHVAASAKFGTFDGVVSAVQLAGDFRAFDFAALPPEWFGELGSPLAGPVDARVDLARLAEQWSGSARIEGAAGSLALPGALVAIPYDTLNAALRLDEVGALQVESVALSGPMVAATASGEVAAGYAGPATGEIAIEVDVEHVDPALLPTLAQYGVLLDPNGAGHLTISGQPDQIQIR